MNKKQVIDQKQGIDLKLYRYFDHQKKEYNKPFPEKEVASLLKRSRSKQLRNPVFSIVTYAFIILCFTALLFAGGKPSYFSKQINSIAIKYEIDKKLDQAIKKIEEVL